MIIINKDQGPKIDYEVTGNKITFDDDLTINLAKREEDWAVHIDVCFDSTNCLVVGAAAGRNYVAEIDIPARAYNYVEPEEDRGEEERGPVPVPIPLDMDKVTLTLWEVPRW